MRTFKKPTDQELAEAQVEAAKDIQTANEMIDFFRNSLVDMPGGMEQFDVTVRVASMTRIIMTELEVGPEDLAMILSVAIERLIDLERHQCPM